MVALETFTEKITFILIGQVFNFLNLFTCESRTKGMNPIGADYSLSTLFIAL